MYKIIMAPTDGSDAERPALEVAVTLAQRFDAELRLVRVETPPVVVDPRSGPGVLQQTEESLLEARRARERKLEELADEIRKRGARRVISSLESGRVEPGLRDYANRYGIDLIVMSSHSRGGLQRANLGSVTDYLIRNTEIPTLVVRPPVATVSGPGGPFARIIIPLDGSTLAEQVIPHVIALAGGSQARVDLLRILTPVIYSDKKQINEPAFPWWEEAVTEAKSYLDLIGGLFDNIGLLVTKEVVIGDEVVAAIIDYCIRERADLLAMATHGVGGVKRLVFGTIADELTRHSPTSALVFHPRQTAA